MTDEELAPWLMGRIRAATGATDSRLSREREIAARYYDGQEPKPLHSGNSKYVSMDVYDSVETMKAILVETFTGNTTPVQFAANGTEDVEEARIATAYSNFVVYGQNDGYSVIRDVIHDGLMNRVGLAMVYWKKDVSWVEIEMPPLPPESAISALQTLEQHGEKTKDRKVEKNEDGTLTVTYQKRVDQSRVVLENVPPEEFGISPRAKNMVDAEMVYRGTHKSKSDLLKMGFDEEIIEDMWNDESVWLDTAPEVLQRFNDVDDAAFLGLGDHIQDARRQIMVYWCFCKLDLDDTGISDLYNVVIAGNRVLDKTRVNRLPFLAFSPLAKPHSFWGSSFAQQLQQTQNARTLLTRSIVDHAVITTNPRWTVVRGALVNTKELLENRIGGIVNITRDGAVMPLPTASLNPFIFQTLNNLKEDKEQNSGISSLSQGLNKDALSNQNSADMVNQMINESRPRQKIIARNFATQFLKELYLAVYQLVVENEKQERVVEVAGNYVPVDPTSWASRRDVSVAFALGYGEADKEAKKWSDLHTGLIQVPALQTSYGPAQQYAVIRKYMETSGIKDPDSYLLPPDKAPKPQPDPVQQALVQVPLREVAVKEGHLKLATAQQQFDTGHKQAETGLKAQREAASIHATGEKLAHMDRKADLDDAKFHHEMVVDAAEIALQRQAQTITASPSPRGTP